MTSSCLDNRSNLFRKQRPNSELALDWIHCSLARRRPRGSEIHMREPTTVWDCEGLGLDGLTGEHKSGPDTDLHIGITMTLRVCDARKSAPSCLERRRSCAKKMIWLRTIALFLVRRSAEAFSTSSTCRRSSRLRMALPRYRDVQFANPLVEYGYPPAVTEDQSNKPILLYLPGFDGTYICPFLQFPELGEDFDVRCMTVSMQDRSTFEELRESVLQYLDDIQNEGNKKYEDFLKNEGDASDCVEDSIIPHNDTETETSKASKGSGGFLSAFPFIGMPKRRKETPARPIYLAGESFGGILACEVARSVQQQRPKHNQLKGLILINSATCYDRSRLADKGPNVATMPWFAYPFGILTQLFPLFGDDYSVSELGLILSGKALPSVIDNPMREAYMGRVAFSLPTKLKFMPQSTLSWRLREWLSAGCGMVSLDSLAVRILLVAGERDRALPSIAEAERLASLLPTTTQVHVVRGAGHASTCGSRIDLAAVLRERFPELRASSKRTSMKPSAEPGVADKLGMEPRYDGSRIGLSPLKYWSKEYYRPAQPKKGAKDR